MKNFRDMALPDALQLSLEALNFTTPTPIQAQTIPLALEGKDVLGSAQTGTGKTLAFSVPLVSYVLNNQSESALVLCPTRELAQQVFKTICTLIPRGERTYGSLLIGGESFSKQVSQLRRDPRIIVATPGRMIDHLEQGTVDGSTFSFLVLDETDRMFDMGFSVQLEDIIKRLPKERQTLMFSATIAPEIETLTKKYLKTPSRISVDSLVQPVQAITQRTVNLKETEKYDNLINEINQEQGSVIVFVKTKRSAEIIADNLDRDGHEVECIHGDLRQNKRERVMTAFRKGRYRIMVATDVAARGLDVPHIKLVINYDLPQCPEDYIHRIGRTGRAGAEGAAVNFIAGHDKRNWEAIQRMMDPEKYKNAPRLAPQSFGRRGGSSSRSNSSFGGSSRSRSFDGERSSDRRSSSRGGFGDERPARRNSDFSDRPARDGETSSRRSSSRDSFGRDERPARSSFGDERPARREGSRESRSSSRGGFSSKPSNDRFDSKKSNGRGFSKNNAR